MYDKRAATIEKTAKKGKNTRDICLNEILDFLKFLLF